MGNTVVVVAPFTAERTNLRVWEDLFHRLQRAAEGAVTMVWLYLSREELLQRIRDRGADRDASKLREEQRFIDQLDFGPPVGPHIPIHAVGSVDQIVLSIINQLKSRLRPAIDGLARRRYHMTIETKNRKTLADIALDNGVFAIIAMDQRNTLKGMFKAVDIDASEEDLRAG